MSLFTLKIACSDNKLKFFHTIAMPLHDSVNRHKRKMLELCPISSGCCHSCDKHFFKYANVAVRGHIPLAEF